MYERERDLNMLLSCFREKMPGFRCPLRDERWRERGREGNTAGVARRSLGVLKKAAPFCLLREMLI